MKINLLFLILGIVSFWKVNSSASEEIYCENSCIEKTGHYEDIVPQWGAGIWTYGKKWISEEVSLGVFSMYGSTTVDTFRNLKIKCKESGKNRELTNEATIKNSCKEVSKASNLENDNLLETDLKSKSELLARYKQSNDPKEQSEIRDALVKLNKNLPFQSAAQPLYNREAAQ
jgi:hypothetical protein